MQFQTGNSNLQSSSHYAIGIMSGTSLDGLDAVIVSFDDQQNMKLVGQFCESMPEQLALNLRAISAPGQDGVHEVKHTEYQLTLWYAKAISTLLSKHNLNEDQIAVIGTTGQTIRHDPDGLYPYTCQILDAPLLSKVTNIPVASGFRASDMALGGQGAPLAPAFHRWFFENKLPTTKAVGVLNLGGIGNLTTFKKSETKLIGFDTGPANGILNQIAQKFFNLSFDDAGNIAKSGNINPALLAKLLEDSYIKASFPKSTGPEHFNLCWLLAHMQALNLDLNPTDLMATANQFSARCAAESIDQVKATEVFNDLEQLYVCGGGIHNQTLIQALEDCIASQNISLESTQVLGLDPQLVEASCMAWYGWLRSNSIAVDLRYITGASSPAILGHLSL